MALHRTSLLNWTPRHDCTTVIAYQCKETGCLTPYGYDETYLDSSECLKHIITIQSMPVTCLVETIPDWTAFIVITVSPAPGISVTIKMTNIAEVLLFPPVGVQNH